MKICIVSYIYPTSKNRTLGLFVHYQARELAKTNEVYVITKYHKNMPDYELIDGINVYRIGYLNFNFGLISKIITLHHKFNFDVIHSHFLGFSTFVCGVVSKLIKVPFVVTLHGSEILFANMIKRIYLSFPKKVMCVSRYTAELTKKIIDKSKIVVVNNGVDIKRLRPSISNRLFRKQIGLVNDKMILSVADLVKRKGLDTVVMALPLLKKDFPSLAYVIIGEGPEKKNLIELAKKLKVDKKIRFISHVSDEELSNYYNACDIFVLMSRTMPKEKGVEGFGIVFIEASLFSKPVIAGKSGGTADAVVDGVTGFLIDSDNRNELQKKITLLLKNPKLRKRLGINGRSFVIKNMLWSHNARKTVKVYKDVIGAV